MRSVGAVGKDEKNKQQNFDFRSIVQVYNRLQPLMATHGIFSSPRVLDVQRETHQTAKGGTLHYAVVHVEYTFWAEDGSSFITSVVGEGMDSGDKASNKAMAAAHKYALCQTFCIPYEVVDPDANTPEWMHRKMGSVSKIKFTEFKARWCKAHKGKGVDDFIAWCRHATDNKILRANDHTAWSPEELEKCEEALKGESR